MLNGLEKKETITGAGNLRKKTDENSVQSSLKSHSLWVTL